MNCGIAEVENWDLDKTRQENQLSGVDMTQKLIKAVASYIAGLTA